MMEPSTVQLIINSLVGPGGGLLVSVGVLYWVGTRLFPEVRKFLADITERLDRVTASMERIDRSLKELQESVTELNEDIRPRAVRNRVAAN